MEIIVNEQHTIPDLAVRNRLIENSRRARLDLEEVGIELDEVIAKLDELIRQQKRARIEKRKQIQIDSDR
jgi:hypothetical protein